MDIQVVEFIKDTLKVISSVVHSQSNKVQCLVTLSTQIFSQYTTYVHTATIYRETVDFVSRYFYTIAMERR